MLVLAFLLESSDGLSFFIGLSSSSNSNASVGLDGADDDLNEDSKGVIGLGCPAGNDVGGNAFTFSSVCSSVKRTFCFLLISISFHCFNRGFQRGWNLHWLEIVVLLSLNHFLLSSALAMTASASSSLNCTITCSRGMSVCAAGNASALLLVAMILPWKLA